MGAGKEVGDQRQRVLPDYAVAGNVVLLPQEAGADDEIGLSFQHGEGDCGDIRGAMLAVAIQDDDDHRGKHLGRTEAGVQSDPLAIVGLVLDDDGTGSAGDEATRAVSSVEPSSTTMTVLTYSRALRTRLPMKRSSL
jgi:hypothetical protein